MKRAPRLDVSALDTEAALVYIGTSAGVPVWKANGRWFAVLPCGCGDPRHAPVKWALGTNAAKAVEAMCWAAAQLEGSAEA